MGAGADIVSFEAVREPVVGTGPGAVGAGAGAVDAGAVGAGAADAILTMVKDKRLMIQEDGYPLIF